MTSRIAVVGLGIMGSRLAARLIGAGFTVRGYDPDAERMREFSKIGGIEARSPGEAAEGCWAVVLSLLTSDIAREVCLGEGGIHTCGTRPLLVLDTTTGRPTDAVDTAAGLAPGGIDYADMTISGNAEVAERGELTLILGGSPEAFAAACPIMEAVGKSHHHVGPVGAGAKAKLVVNHVLAINRAGLAEGLVAAELAGIDLEGMLEVLKAGAAYSQAMDLWGARMVAGDHERPNSRLQQSHKDSRLIVSQTEALGAPHELVATVGSMLSDGLDAGLGDLDNSAIIEVLRREAGVGRVPVQGAE